MPPFELMRNARSGQVQIWLRGSSPNVSSAFARSGGWFTSVVPAIHDALLTLDVSQIRSSEPQPPVAMSILSSPTLKPLRKDLLAFADDAAKIAQTQIVSPALQSVRHMRKAMLNRASQAQHYAAAQCDHLAQQISARPFTSVAIAFCAGWIGATLLGLMWSGDE
jgi:ElaB/YqjD/DUF883 family membrane-anchored ribosome-binding protein